MLPTRRVIVARLTRRAGHARDWFHRMVMSVKTTILPPKITTLFTVIAARLTVKKVATVGRTTN